MYQVGCRREQREISPLRRPTPSQERRWKKRRRSASVEMTSLRRCVGVNAKFLKLIGGNLCFFQQHHRNVIPNAIDPLACLAFKSRAIGQELYRSFALRAYQNIQQILSHCHASLRAEVRRECDFSKATARAATRVTSWIFREFQFRLYRAATCFLDFAYFDAGVPSSLALDPA